MWKILTYSLIILQGVSISLLYAAYSISSFLKLVFSFVLHTMKWKEQCRELFNQYKEYIVELNECLENFEEWFWKYHCYVYLYSVWKLVQIKIWYRVTNIRSSLIIVYQVNYTFLFILNIPPLYTFFLHLRSGKQVFFLTANAANLKVRKRGYTRYLRFQITFVKKSCFFIQCAHKHSFYYMKLQSYM